MVRVVVKVGVMVRETIMVNTTKYPNPQPVNKTRQIRQLKTAAARNNSRKKNPAIRQTHAGLTPKAL